MGKFLLSTLLLLTTAFASTAETVTFDNGLPDGWQKIAGTVANQTRVSKKCLQLQKGASISSPSYSNISEIKLSLNISSNATSFTVAQSLDNENWTTLRTIAKSECSTSSWTDFTISTQGDTSNGVYFKLSSDASSYYISTFEYTVTSPEDPDKCATPVAKVGDKVVVGNDKLFVNDELTFSCSTEGATITYSLIGGEYNVNNEVFNGKSIKLNKAALYTIKAKATVTGKDASDELVIEDIDVVKRNADISFTKSTATAYLDAISEFTTPDLLNPNNLVGISYTSSNPEIATVAADGTVSPLAVGETTITAAFAGNDEYEAGEAKYVFKVEAEKPLSLKIVFNTTTSTDGSDFKDTDKNSDIISEGSEYVSAITVGERAWHSSKNGIKLGASSNIGSINFTLDKYYKINAIKVDFVKYGSDAKSSVTINDKNSIIENDGEITYDYLESNYVNCLKISTVKDTGVKPRVYIKSIMIEYEVSAVVPDPEFESGHEAIENGQLTLAKNSHVLKFKKVEGVDIYYKLTKKEAAPNTRAEVDHTGFTKLEDYNKGIELSTADSALEYYAFANGIKSEHQTLAVNLTGDTETGVAEIEAAGAGEVRWFDMQGREVKGQPEKGIYVRVVNGKASKVIL